MSDGVAVIVGYVWAIVCTAVACTAFGRLAAGGNPLWFAGVIVNAYGAIICFFGAIELHMLMPGGLWYELRRG